MVLMHSAVPLDVAFITEDEIARETRGTFLRDYRVRQQQAACRNWPKLLRRRTAHP